MKSKLTNRFLWLLVVFGGLFQSQVFADSAIKPEVPFISRANAAIETTYEFMGHPYLGCNIPYKSINDASGNLYITGGSSDPEAPSGCMAVIKVDTDGNMVWEKRMPVEDFVVEMGMAITLDSEDNPIASGIYWNGDNMDIQTMKLNKADGEIIWRSVFDGGHEGMDVPKEIMIDDDDNIIIGGYAYGGQHITYLTLKYDSSGQQLWYDIDELEGIPDNVRVEPSAMDIDNDGNIVLAGYGSSPDYYKIYYTIKYSADGQQLWKKDYLHKDGDWDTNSEIFDAQFDEAGNCYVTGRLDMYGGKIGTIKYNVSGEQEWVEIHDSNAGDLETAAIEIVSDTVYVLAGFIQYYSSGSSVLISYGTDGQMNWAKSTNDGININNVRLNANDDGSLIALIRATDPDGVEYLPNNKFWVRKYSADGDIEAEATTSLQALSTYTVYNIVGMGMDENENAYFTSYCFHTSVGAVFEYLKMPFASGEIDPEWIKQYASPTGGSSTTMLNSLADNEGNTYVVGRFSIIENEQFIQAYYLAKYDEQGKMEWKKDFTPASEGSAFEGIQLTLNKDGEPYVLLMPDSWAGGLSAIKSYSGSGDLKWEDKRQLSSSMSIIVTDNDNNFYIAGGSGSSIAILKYSDAGEAEDVKYVTTKSGCTVTGAAINSEGNIVWIGSVSSTTMMAANITPDGELIWLGEVAAGGTAVDLCIDDDDNVFLTGYVGNNQVTVAKIDNAGNEIWKETYDQGTRRVRPYRILPSGEDGLIISMYSNDFIMGNNRIVVLKYDKDGNFQWDFNTEYDHFYYGMHVDEEENTYILSQLALSTFPKRMYYSMSPMTYAGLQKIDADGELIKTDAFVGPHLSPYFPRTLVAHPEGKLLICGDVNNEQSFYSGLYFFETITIEYPVTGIELNQYSADMIPGETLQLIATILPDNATNKNVTWSSQNEAVATVSADGLVTAVGKGNTIISVTTEDGEYTSQCNVNVILPVTSVTLNMETLTLTEGDTETLVATINPDDADNQNVSWESSNEAVATVSANGLVTAVAEGNAVITVTTEDGGKTATCTVTVGGVGIDRVEDNIQVYCHNNNLVFKGCAGYDFMLYAVNGILAGSFSVKDNEQSFLLSVPAGVYILKGHNGSRGVDKKIIVK